VGLNRITISEDILRIKNLIGLPRKIRFRNERDEIIVQLEELGHKVEELEKKYREDKSPINYKRRKQIIELLKSEGGMTSSKMGEKLRMSRSRATEYLKNMGAVQIKCFADGKSAASWFNANPRPDLVIQEWRIPQLSGPMLLQRIQSSKAVGSPIIVLSSLIECSDIPFIREMGVAEVIAKPVGKREFISGIIRVMQQDRLPTDHQALERKIRSSLQKGQYAEAKSLAANYCASSKVHEGQKKLISGNHLSLK